MNEQYKQHEQSGEQQNSVHEIKEHHERAQKHHEKAAEKAGREIHHEQAKARHEVREQAISGAEHHKPQSEKRQHRPVYTKRDKDHAFDTTMHHVQSNMSKPERTFSKLIHKSAVEKTSEVLGKTVARPSGIAGATIAAFIGLLSVYSIAKFAGFQLSGSEMPLLIVIGFVTGLFIEWAYKAARAVLAR